MEEMGEGSRCDHTRFFETAPFERLSAAVSGLLCEKLPKQFKRD